MKLDITVKTTLATDNCTDAWIASARHEWAQMTLVKVEKSIASKRKTLEKTLASTPDDTVKIDKLQEDIAELEEASLKILEVGDGTKDAHDEYLATFEESERPAITNLLRLSAAYSDRGLLQYVLPETADYDKARDMLKGLLRIHSFGRASESGRNTSSEEEYAQTQQAVIDYYRPFFDYTGDKLAKKVRVKKAVRKDEVKGVDGSFMFALHEQFICGATTNKKGTTLKTVVKSIRDEFGDTEAYDMAKLNAIVCDLLFRVIFG